MKTRLYVQITNLTRSTAGLGGTSSVEHHMTTGVAISLLPEHVQWLLGTPQPLP